MTESELEFKFTNQCAFEGCKQLATIWACGQKLLNTQGHPNPAKYCNDHAALVSDEDNPELY